MHNQLAIKLEFPNENSVLVTLGLRTTGDTDDDLATVIASTIKHSTLHIEFIGDAIPASVTYGPDGSVLADSRNGPLTKALGASIDEAWGMPGLQYMVAGRMVALIEQLERCAPVFFLGGFKAYVIALTEAIKQMPAGNGRLPRVVIGDDKMEHAVEVQHGGDPEMPLHSLDTAGTMRPEMHTEPDLRYVLAPKWHGVGVHLPTTEKNGHAKVDSVVAGVYGEPLYRELSDDHPMRAYGHVGVYLVPGVAFPESNGVGITFMSAKNLPVFVPSRDAFHLCGLMPVPLPSYVSMGGNAELADTYTCDEAIKVCNGMDSEAGHA